MIKSKRGIVIGIVAGILIILGSFLFFGNPKIFYFLIGVGVLIGLLPFVVFSVIDTKKERDKDEMFLEFTRSLVQSVEAGTPISKSIVNLRGKNFGSLTENIEKLANQIELGIPVSQALEVFARDSRSKTIIRAVTLIREAEKTGGNISNILDSVARSTAQIEKLKAERRAAISSIVMEGYIIFIVFIVIMVIMDVQIIPLTSSITSISAQGQSLPGSGVIGTTPSVDVDSFSLAFLSLLMTQGLFAGLIIGKLAEGKIKAGIKHSFIMVAMAFLISTLSSILLK